VKESEEEKKSKDLSDAVRQYFKLGRVPPQSKNNKPPIGTPTQYPVLKPIRPPLGTEDCPLEID